MCRLQMILLATPLSVYGLVVSRMEGRLTIDLTILRNHFLDIYPDSIIDAMRRAPSKLMVLLPGDTLPTYVGVGHDLEANEIVTELDSMLRYVHRSDSLCALDLGRSEDAPLRESGKVRPIQLHGW
jgi:hypothetical protein